MFELISGNLIDVSEGTRGRVEEQHLWVAKAGPNHLKRVADLLWLADIGLYLEGYAARANITCQRTQKIRSAGSEAYFSANRRASDAPIPGPTPITAATGLVSVGVISLSSWADQVVWSITLQRRARAAGIPTAVCNHTFQATGITAYLNNGGSLENAQAMAAHESPRTTKLYDRTDDQITLDEVEKIGI